MTKQLYEEALADVKKLKEVAEANATRALLDVVTPKIRDLIENQLLGEDAGVEEEEADPDKILTDEPSESSHEEAPAHEEYSLNAESAKSLGALISGKNDAELDRKIRHLGEKTERLKGASPLITETNGYFDAVSSVISEVEDTYSKIQSGLGGDVAKKSAETVLEGYYSTLKQLMERKMNRKNRLSEAEITLKLGGVPDELADKLDDLDVTLVSGEDEEAGGDEDLDLGGDEGEEEGGDEELDLDLGGDEGEEESDEEEETTEEGDYMESRRLNDDTIVEIDESMLRREISRMKALREESSNPPQIKGLKAHGPGKVADGFEDDDLGDPFVDIDLRESQDQGEEDDDLDEAQSMSDDEGTLHVGKGKKEESDDLDEADDLDEQDMDQQEMDQAEKRRAKPGHDEDVMQPNVQKDMPTESIRQRLAAESKLQLEAKKKASQAKKMQKEAQKKAQQSKKMQEKQQAKKQSKKMQEAYNFYARRFNESVARTHRLKGMLAEAAQNDRTLNGASSRSAEETNNLRTKLAETNLFNAKLLFTNKLLQNEALTKRQKAEVIERLDEAKTEREVKLVYESLTKALAGSSGRSLTETVDRGVIGSSSRPARPAAATNTLNEGFEADRWAKLAGIAK